MRRDLANRRQRLFDDGGLVRLLLGNFLEDQNVVISVFGDIEDGVPASDTYFLFFEDVDSEEKQDKGEKEEIGYESSLDHYADKFY